MIIQRQSGLGRGLGALIPPKPPSSPPAVPQASSEAPRASGGEVGGQITKQIPIQNIVPNPHQPRQHFDHGQLEDLISSIREHGVLQPLVVSPLPDGKYELIAGERRLRASTIAGLNSVPAIVRDATEQQKLELAIIENVQRQDLNSIEEAHAYTRLMEEFNLTQDEVSRKVGRSRPGVANTLRLLQLPQEIQQALIESRISTSNARTLLSLPSETEQMNLFRSMLAGNFTVRQTEEQVNTLVRRPTRIDPNISAQEEVLRSKYKVRVSIKPATGGSGEIRFKYGSEEEFRNVLEQLRGSE